MLAKLDSLDVVLTATENIEGLITETQATGPAAEVLRNVDGVKSVKQIGALSALGEFDVCKILAAGIVVGALSKAPAPAPGRPAGRGRRRVLPTGGARGRSTVSSRRPGRRGRAPVRRRDGGARGTTVPPVESSSSDTVFQPADNTAFEAESGAFSAPSVPEPEPASEPGPFEPPASFQEAVGYDPGDETELDTYSRGGEPGEFPDAGSESEADLMMDEPEAGAGDYAVRTAPRPKRMRGGSSIDIASIAKLAAVVLVAVGAAYAVYTFAWPMVAPMITGSGSSPSTGASAQASPAPAGGAGAGATSPAPVRPAPAEATGGAASPGPQPAPPSAPPAAPRPQAAPPPSPQPAGATASAPRPTPAPSRPAPPPETTQRPAPAAASGRGRQLLAAGDLRGAATAFRSELAATASNKFTVAVGLYCSVDNANRVLANAGGSSQIYVLPASVNAGAASASSGAPSTAARRPRARRARYPRHSRRRRRGPPLARALR